MAIFPSKQEKSLEEKPAKKKEGSRVFKERRKERKGRKHSDKG